MNQFTSTLKTTLFLGLLTGFFLLIGATIGGRTGMVIALLFATAMNLGAWWYSDKLAIRFSGARPLPVEEQPDLHRMTELLAQRAGIPTPALYLIESESPNAFATGRSPAHGAIAITTGLQSTLTRAEVAGVIAHEMAHIRNRDTLISSIAATFAGAITMIAEMTIWSMIFGGDEEEGGGILMLFLAPIAALLIQLAVSRSREYAADAAGATLLGTPQPLASALEKLETAAKRTPLEAAPATAHLYIVSPLLGGMGGLFRTHPETAKRVAALHALPMPLEQSPLPAIA
jgi:heat shock protein HtpX